MPVHNCLARNKRVRASKTNPFANREIGGPGQCPNYPQKNPHIFFSTPKPLKNLLKPRFPPHHPRQRALQVGGQLFFQPRPYPATIFENQISHGHHRAPDHPCPDSARVSSIKNQKSKIKNSGAPMPRHDVASAARKLQMQRFATIFTPKRSFLHLSPSFNSTYVMQHNAKTDHFMLHRLPNTLQRRMNRASGGRILSGYGIINNHFCLSPLPGCPEILSRPISSNRRGRLSNRPLLC